MLFSYALNFDVYSLAVLNSFGNLLGIEHSFSCSSLSYGLLVKEAKVVDALLPCESVLLMHHNSLNLLVDNCYTRSDKGFLCPFLGKFHFDYKEGSLENCHFLLTCLDPFGKDSYEILNFLERIGIIRTVDGFKCDDSL